MKKGGDRHSAAMGFTIVETLIVLAVTSVLLISAMLLISGRQNTTLFQTGVNDLRQKLQQVINETASGYYPNQGNVSCTRSTSGPALSSATKALGSNGHCTFVGAVIVMSPQPALDNKRMVIYPLAGLRQYNDAGVYRDARSIKEARPTAIAPVSVGDGLPDARTSYTFQNISLVSSRGVNNRSVPAITDYAVPIFTATAIITNFGQASASSSTLATGSRTLYMNGFCNGWATVSIDQAAGYINDASNGTCESPDDGNFVRLTGMYMCFASEVTNQSAIVSIGGAGGGLDVDVKIISGNRTCH